MSQNDEVTSVALYTNSNGDQHVPREFLDRVVSRWFDHWSRRPEVFWADGGPFNLDDGMRSWSDENQLRSTLELGTIESIGVSSLRNMNEDQTEWTTTVSTSVSGTLYFGVVASLLPPLDETLLLAKSAVQELYDVRYGIAYRMPMSDEPDCYALGAKSITFAKFKDRMRLRAAGTPPAKTPDDLWREELIGRRRHLAGLFRGAYPASILSDAHLQSLKRSGSPPGNISRLDSGHWLWTLAPDEVSTAQTFLEASQALVSQASER